MDAVVLEHRRASEREPRAVVGIEREDVLPRRGDFQDAGEDVAEGVRSQRRRDADVEAEKQPEKVIPRIQAMLGPDHEFDLEWVSVYTFQCRRMTRFRNGRVLFAGDAAHQVSPFGARGANSGFQDTDALMWKLALVLQGQAPEKLLDSYAQEREFAADENILNSTRSTDFITPKTRTSRHFRNAVLELARDHSFARKLVNSGRLSMPSFLVISTLTGPLVRN